MRNVYFRQVGKSYRFYANGKMIGRGTGDTVEDAARGVVTGKSKFLPMGHDERAEVMESLTSANERKLLKLWKTCGWNDVMSPELFHGDGGRWSDHIDPKQFDPDTWGVTVRESRASERWRGLDGFKDGEPAHDTFPVYDQPTANPRVKFTYAS